MLTNVELVAWIGVAIQTASLAVLAWYTVETARSRRIQELIRDHQRAADERENHPWIAAATLKAQWDVDGRTPFGAWRLALPITNCGRTPALDLHVAVTWSVLGRDRDTEARRELRGEAASGEVVVRRSGQKNADAGALVPTDTCHVTLPPIEILDPEDVTEVSAVASYRSVSGTQGRLEVRFRDDAPSAEAVGRGWRNLPTAYVILPSAEPRTADSVGS